MLVPPPVTAPRMIAAVQLLTALLPVTVAGAADAASAAHVHNMHAQSVKAAQAAVPRKPTGHKLALTTGQAAFLAGVADRAPNASAASTPRILAALDAPRFRAELERCCGSIAHMGSAQLLGLLEAEMEAGELTHNFKADGHYNDSAFGDANLTAG